MQDTTIRWHVYSLTHSPIALGMIGLCKFIPIVLCSLFGGALADAKDRRSIMLLTQTALALSAALLAFLSLSGKITETMIYGMSALSASALAFDSPARQSLIPALVPRKHYPNAISLNSTVMKIATVVGPTVAGILLVRGNYALIYGLNALSYLAVITALLRIKPKTMERPEVSQSRTAGQRNGPAALADGLRFVWGKPVLVGAIGLDFLASFFSSLESLMPIFAKDILHVGARGYGFLTASGAVGSVVAGVIMAFRKPIVRQGAAMLVAVTVYGCATILFGLSHVFWLSVIALALTGAADTVSSILRQTIRQMDTPDHLRGRMTSINMVFIMGGPQLGNMEAGLVASLMGAPWSVVSGGIGCLLAVAW
ncbi:MAG: Major facilitator superfamily 1, partial [Chthonomonadales bacterium]|nr:Major facilitator superfamily 1 [Chthonomonadales bacterium]